MHQPDNQSLIQFSTWKRCQVYTPATRIVVTLPHDFWLEQLTKAGSFYVVSITGRTDGAGTTFDAGLSLFTANTPSSASRNTGGIKAEETRFFLYCLKFLSAYTESFSSGCSCGCTNRASSTCLSVPSLCLGFFLPLVSSQPSRRSIAGQTHFPHC